MTESRIEGGRDGDRRGESDILLGYIFPIGMKAMIWKRGGKRTKSIKMEGRNR